MRYVGEADTVADCLATSGLIWLKHSVFAGVGVCVIRISTRCDEVCRNYGKKENGCDMVCVTNPGHKWAISGQWAAAGHGLV